MCPISPDPPRPVGLTKDAGWEIGVSRTVDAPLEQVWAFLTGAEGRSLWLGAGAEIGSERGTPYLTDDGVRGEVRGYQEHRRIRLTWQPAGWNDPAILQLGVAARGERTMIRFHQERLADAAAREERRAHWNEVLDRLAAELEGAAWER